MMLSLGSRGGRFMTSFSPGSNASATSCRPLVTRLIHKSLGRHEWYGKPQGDCADYGQDGRYPRGDEEERYLADIVEDYPPLDNGAEYTGEIVVGDDHVRRFLCDVGTGPPHGDPHVGCLERRGVIDAVPVTATISPFRIACGQSELVLRGTLA